MVRYGMPFSALPAGLPPFTVSQFASAMDSLVRERVNQLKVFDSVIEWLAVDMVKVLACWDCAVMPFPNKYVFHTEASTDWVVDAAITLGRD